MHTLGSMLLVSPGSAEHKRFFLFGCTSTWTIGSDIIREILGLEEPTIENFMKCIVRNVSVKGT